MRRILALIPAVAVLLSGCAASNDAASIEVARDEAPMTADYDFNIYNVTGRSGTEFKSVGECADTQPAAGELEDDAKPYSLPESSEDAPVTQADAIGDSVYTRFSQSDYSVCNEDGTAIFVGQDTSVTVSTTSRQTGKWLDAELSVIAESSLENQERLLADAGDQYAYLSEKGMLSDFYPYSYYVYARTARQDSEILSLLMVNSAYRGGAHPDSWQTASNFDLVDHRKLALDDVICDGQRKTLRDMVLGDLQDRFTNLSGYVFYDNYQDLVEESITGAVPTDNWYFTEDGLVIYYNNYDIAPYAAGTIEVELPYSRLKGILEPDFFPEERGGGSGALTLTAESGGENEILIQLLSDDGAPIWETTIGVRGIVYDVRMYQVSTWLTDETPVLGNMIFSASHLSESDRVTIVSSNGRENAYLITYRTGAGEEQTDTLDLYGLEKANVRIGG